MKKEEFNQTLREIAILVMTVFAWGIILVIATAVVVNIITPPSYLVYVIRDGLVLVNMVGVFFALSRLYKLVYALPDDEEQE